MDMGIVYATKTKHSRKLAEAMGQRLKLVPENILQNSDPKGADLLFILGGIYGGESMPELLAYLQKLDAATVKNVVLMTSCASGKQKQVSARKILEDKGINVLDEFICKGAILFVSLGHPNKKDLTEAANFAEKIIAGLS